MKTCSVCATMNLDSDLTCGVCGAKLDGTARPLAVVTDTRQREFPVKALIGVALGISLTAAGLYVALPAAFAYDPSTGLPEAGPVSIFVGLMMIVVGASVSAGMTSLFKGQFLPTSLGRAAGNSERFRMPIMDPDQALYPIGQPAANFIAKRTDQALEKKRLERQDD